MSIRNLFLLICTLLALGVTMDPAIAQVSLSIDINTPPPPPRVEVVPAQRPGYVWAPGYWRWEGNRHVWAEGHWMEARRGYHYVPEHWEQRNGRHHFEPGRWEREPERRERGDRERDRR